jgi:hypothetical protein
MAILDVLMTGFTGSEAIKNMTEKSIKSLSEIINAAHREDIS